MPIQSGSSVEKGERMDKNVLKEHSRNIMIQAQIVEHHVNSFYTDPSKKRSSLIFDQLHKLDAATNALREYVLGEQVDKIRKWAEREDDSQGN